MFLRISLVSLLFSLSCSVFAQEDVSVVKDLRSDWMQYEDNRYQPLTTFPINGVSTVYFRVDPIADDGNLLRLRSSDPYFVFINGKVKGDYDGETFLPIDSLSPLASRRPVLVAVHQRGINERDLVTEIVSREQHARQTEMQNVTRPYSHFRDFVVLAGLVTIVLFLIALRLNPKLAGDYLSVTRMFSARDSDDSQAARLTGGSNVQFYILCSVMIAYYLMITLYNLPSRYSLPGRFQASGFGMMWLQWLKLSALVFIALMIKILIIFILTRLFGMRGMARFHFFNWIRVLLVVLGVATVLLFMYFISRGDSETLYVMFLSLVAITLSVWIIVAFFKFGGKSGHSMFHLFSYLCATEIIPLLITVKVLFE
ncbi:MAG TPA: DUF4271 domain-containing protein [Chryseosolibacter sp.]|nr:DUF4271 domain-containing protein [Chryseosolibacter sp.]